MSAAGWGWGRSISIAGARMSVPCRFVHNDTHTLTDATLTRSRGVLSLSSESRETHAQVRGNVTRCDDSRPEDIEKPKVDSHHASLKCPFTALESGNKQVPRTYTIEALPAHVSDTKSEIDKKITYYETRVHDKFTSIIEISTKNNVLRSMCLRANSTAITEATIYGTKSD